MVPFIFVISLSVNQLELTSENEVFGGLAFYVFVCLFCGLTSQSTTMVMSRRSVNLTTLFVVI